MILVLLGPPGAGKGTQCKRIIDKYKLRHLSSGDILRSERAAGTELGKKAQQYMDSGALVPDELIIEMMVAAIADAGWNCVLDGFPRTTVQAARLDDALKSQGKKIDAVIDLQVDDKIVATRITGRRSCPKCGAVYHIETLKPKRQGWCDNCIDTKLVQRDDDKPEVVANRLGAYHKQTAAVVGYYKSVKATVFDVRADGAVDDVTRAVFNKLASLAA